MENNASAFIVEVITCVYNIIRLKVLQIQWIEILLFYNGDLWAASMLT